tara:strand:- start:638 stop:820 length:183 start_codon:yes stop_codon:yes gene_type:complete
MDIAFNVILGTGLFVFLSIVLFFIWDYHKEQQWRKRNPDEWIRLEGIKRGFYKKNKWDQE